MCIYTSRRAEYFAMLYFTCYFMRANTQNKKNQGEVLA